VLEYIKYTNRIPITQEFVPTQDETVLYDLVSEYLRRDNLQALPASQPTFTDDPRVCHSLAGGVGRLLSEEDALYGFIDILSTVET
jgi:hypothetical protein